MFISPLSFPDVMFFLVHRCRNLLWAHRPFIDANLINQAGPEGSGFHGLAGTDIQDAIRFFQTVLCVLSHNDIINV